MMVSSLTDQTIKTKEDKTKDILRKITISDYDNTLSLQRTMITTSEVGLLSTSSQISNRTKDLCYMRKYLSKRDYTTFSTD